MRVLLIEDHRVTRETIVDHLRGTGFAVDAVACGEDALSARGATTYDAIILDLGLPDIDGRALLSRLRRPCSAAPILVLTARESEGRGVEILNGGADDFLRKPFHLPELEARLRAILRRPGARRSVQLVFEDLSFDTTSRTARCGDTAIDLARREASALHCLMDGGGDAVSREVLAQRLYAFDDEVTGNALEAVISRLRRRLVDAGSVVQVEGLRGVGYRLRRQS